MSDQGHIIPRMGWWASACFSRTAHDHHVLVGLQDSSDRRSVVITKGQEEAHYGKRKLD